MTAEIESVGEETLGVVCAMGDWFGGYALFVVDGRAHFTFARAADALALRDNTVMEPGRPASRSPTVRPRWRTGRNGAVDRRPARRCHCGGGMLPLALQHGGAGLRLGFDSRLPRLAPLPTAGRFSGTVHFVKIEALGGAVTSPAEEVRTALHSD